MKSRKDSDTRTQDALACLAVPSRFRLVRAIAEAERCVGELAVSVGLSQSCTTRHLQALERVGLVQGKREGRRVRFTLRAQAGEAESLLELVLGGSRLPAPAEVAAVPSARGGRRRAKPLSSGTMGAGTGRPGPGLDEAGPGPPSPPREEGPAEPLRPERPFRRQDIEDYLL